MKNMDYGVFLTLAAMALPSLALNTESANLFVTSAIVNYFYLILLINVLKTAFVCAHKLSTLYYIKFSDLKEEDSAFVKHIASKKPSPSWLLFLFSANGVLFLKNDYIFTGLLNICSSILVWFITAAVILNAKEFIKTGKLS